MVSVSPHIVIYVTSFIKLANNIITALLLAGTPGVVWVPSALSITAPFRVRIWSEDLKLSTFQARDLFGKVTTATVECPSLSNFKQLCPKLLTYIIKFASDSAYEAYRKHKLCLRLVAHLQGISLGMDKYSKIRRNTDLEMLLGLGSLYNTHSACPSRCK